MEGSITAKELFRNIMNFKPSPRTLRWELAYWEETVLNWYRDGLSGNDSLQGNGPVKSAGPALPWSGSGNGSIRVDNHDISKYFSFDDGLYPIPYRFWLYPCFEEKIVSEDDKYIEKYNWNGIKVRELKDGSSMPMWLEFPLKTREDWEKIKEERLNPDTIKDRYVISVKKYLDDNRAKTSPLGIADVPVGFFGSLRFLMGEERLFMLYYDDPDLIHDICSHLCSLWLAMAEELTSEIDFDYVCFWEDMSGKTGSLISPGAFREFMSPYYKKLIDFLKTRGIGTFIVDTDGKVDELMPLFMEVGINAMLPFERQAGNDLVEYRKKFPQFSMMGGFDKNTLYKGKDAINKELEVMSWLISRGGYIPYGDHAIPPNASWENFKYYREKLNRIIDNTEVCKKRTRNIR